MNSLVAYLNAAADHWTRWMLMATLDSAALLAIIGLVWLAIRRRVAPQVGYWLFLLVVIKLFVPFGVPVPAGVARLTPSALVLPDPIAGSQSPAEQALLRVVAAQPTVDLSHVARTVQRQMGGAHAVSDASAATAIAANRAVSVANVTAPARLSWAAGIMLAWLSIVIALVTRALVIQARFRSSLKRLAPLDAARLGCDLDELRRRAGVAASIRLVESDIIESPAVWGRFRPTIILPRGIVSTLTVGQLRWVLLHELAHVRRFDLLALIVERCAAMLYFFNPAVWIANRMVDRLREDACDDFAVALSGCASVEPADVFLHILRFAQGRRGLTGALGIFGMGTRAACFRRIRRLLDTERTVGHRLNPWAAGALVAVALATLPYLRADNDDNPPPATPGKSAEQPRADSNVAEKPTFELRVVGPDGKPVPHAQVEVRTEPKPAAEQILIGKFIKQGTYGTFATTDDLGRLRIVRPSHPNHFNVDITTPGYGPYCAKWTSETHSEQIPAQFTAELEAGWSVGGVVVDGDGRPIEGVQVHPSIEFKKRPGDIKQLGVGTNIKTDATGKWRFDSVPASASYVFVEISHADYLPLRRRLTRSEFAIEPGGEPTARLELPAGLAVTGKITDESGNPISGALIRTKFLNDKREASSGDDGSYRLIGCEPAITRIVVWALGRALEMKEVRVAPGMDPVDFQLQPGGHVRVRMLDEHGKGVAKGRIFFQRWRGHIKYFEFDHVNQYTDLDGVWEWTEAPLDEFAADICRPDGMQLSEQPLRARDEEYVFKVPPALVVSGSVIDAQTKKPVAKFRVVPGIRSNKPDIKWSRSEQFTSTDGHYSVRQDRAELAHLVRIEADGYQPAVSRDIRSDEGQVTIDFALKKGTDITAQVLTPAGKPAAGAEVAIGIAGSQISINNGRIGDRSTFYSARLDSDETGVFSFPPQEGDYQLVITHPAGFAHVKAKADTRFTNITLGAWARVEGTFRIGKKPVADIPLTLMPNALTSYGDGLPSIFTHHETTTGKEGSFAFERVPPGQARIGRDLRLTADSGALEAISASLVPIELTGGKTTRFDLGGQGRRVEGRLRPPAGHEGTVPWNFALIEAQPKGDDERAEPALRCDATVGRDGAFHLDDLPAGEYRLLVRFSGDPAGHLQDYVFSVPDAKPGEDQPVELGDLTLEGR